MARQAGVLIVAAVTGIMSLLEPARAGAIVVSTAAQLASAVAAANSGGDKVIVLQDGTYTLDNMLWVSASGVTVRSLSGNRDAVIVQGQGMNGGVSHVFNVQGMSFSVSDVTLRRVANHAVQFQPEASSPVIRNVHILDTYEQMVKVAYYPSDMNIRCDNGIMENCLLEYSAGIGPQWYIGGIDAHNARNWIVRGNVFKNIRSPSDAEAEHAVHFWSSSQNTLVERNLIITCDRGIGFGLGDRGHVGGIIRNNMIYHDASEGFADVGISLESAPGAQVYNNSVYQEHSYPNAIEYRFAATGGCLIANNLTNRAISQRDGASATVSHNVTTAQAAWFVNTGAGNLHLSGPVGAVVDQGQAISGLTSDYDNNSRPQGAGIDVGADEYVSGGGGTCTLTCPADMVVTDSNGDGFEVVTFDDPTASGDCGGVTVSPPSGSPFPVGTTTVHCASSRGGAACLFTVTVIAAGQAPPEITGCRPTRGKRGSTLTVAVRGSGFQAGATIAFGAGVTVRSASVTSSDSISATVLIRKRAKTGRRDVSATNPDGQRGSCKGCFRIR